jgi:tRNA threonylcarbamoyladenosine biosynthesis protein TsaB
MILLALDTSTAYASVALASEQRLLAELTWEVGQRHSAELFDRLRWLLASAHTAPSALNGVAVALGPGSFNGTRVALAAAKTLAFALRVPLYGHSTLDVIAWPYSTGTLPIWALLDAGRGQVYAAHYGPWYQPPPAPATWAPAEAPTIMTPKELAEHIADPNDPGLPLLFAGEWRTETRDVLEGVLGRRARFAPVGTGRHAGSLAELALARAAASEADDPLRLEPLYLRKPAITMSTKVALAPYAEEPAAQGAAGGEDVSHALRG